mmetsp:Transcript_21129/g.46554  ORF Transcript_21129/g.46554 Transcript_21129/m.46554 type:complete len:298 (-) Transcript_21129:185-1078(-)
MGRHILGRGLFGVTRQNHLLCYGFCLLLFARGRSLGFLGFLGFLGLGDSLLFVTGVTRQRCLRIGNNRMFVQKALVELLFFLLFQPVMGHHQAETCLSPLPHLLPENLSPLHRTQATEARSGQYGMVTGGFLELLQTPLQKLFMLLQCQLDPCTFLSALKTMLEGPRIVIPNDAVGDVLDQTIQMRELERHSIFIVDLPRSFINLNTSQKLEPKLLPMLQDHCRVTIKTNRGGYQHLLENLLLILQAIVVLHVKLPVQMTLFAGFQVVHMLPELAPLKSPACAEIRTASFCSISKLG